MDVVAKKFTWQFDFVYLDDSVIFSKMPDELISHVRQGMTLLYDAGVTLQQRKGEFFTNWVAYLPNVIFYGSVEVSTRTIDTICGPQYTATVTELLSSLDLCNVFWRFEPNFVRYGSPLNQKLRRGQSQTFDVSSHYEITVQTHSKRN